MRRCIFTLLFLSSITLTGCVHDMLYGLFGKNTTPGPVVPQSKAEERASGYGQYD